VTVVFEDEAHHTKKGAKSSKLARRFSPMHFIEILTCLHLDQNLNLGHVFNVIMKEHYFTLAPRHRPKVLALSATLAEPQGDIKTTVDATLEKALALDCKLVVPTSPEAKATLREAINLPVIEFKKISPQPDFDRWLQVLRSKLITRPFLFTIYIFDFF